VRTVRSECLDHLIPVSERHLRAILTEFVHYYNHDRPHRSLGLHAPSLTVRSRKGGIAVRYVLGGLHHVYERAA
jgi:putative transposase